MAYSTFQFQLEVGTVTVRSLKLGFMGCSARGNCDLCASNITTYEPCLLSFTHITTIMK